MLSGCWRGSSSSGEGGQGGAQPLRLLGGRGEWRFSLSRLQDVFRMAHPCRAGSVAHCLALMLPRRLCSGPCRFLDEKNKDHGINVRA